MTPSSAVASLEKNRRRWRAYWDRPWFSSPAWGLAAGPAAARHGGGQDGQGGQAGEHPRLYGAAACPA